ncbi:macrophage migration inhibitory factor [Chanos chanos]|uniref:Macrophage migration inhibitory factor n=1 Tax=Chanos chanos TaxID=29144 RepID=A0A6J2X0K4_CHACN|nr:macrophage migration inhibitory factor-like [Chanos chanos]
MPIQTSLTVAGITPSYILRWPTPVNGNLYKNFTLVVISVSAPPQSSRFAKLLLVAPPPIMPLFMVNTNVAKSKVPAALFSEATRDLAEALNKPESYITVHIIPDQMMMCAGNTDPVAYCSLKSIGRISPEKNKEYTKLICGLLNKHLGISPERCFILFTDLPGVNVGLNNDIFE